MLVDVARMPSLPLELISNPKIWLPSRLVRIAPRPGLPRRAAATLPGARATPVAPPRGVAGVDPPTPAHADVSTVALQRNAPMRSRKGKGSARMSNILLRSATLRVASLVCRHEDFLKPAET